MDKSNMSEEFHDWLESAQLHGARNTEKQHTRFGRRTKMSAIKKKSETCGEQLRRMCKSIAEEITAGKQDAYEYLKDVYDMRYIVDREKRYFSAELLVAGGGPTIWVSLYTKEVEGFWGSDRVQEPFIDNIGLDDYCEDLYASS
jgi:hypothetical protein